VTELEGDAELRVANVQIELRDATKYESLGCQDHAMASFGPHIVHLLFPSHLNIIK
jgi:hypothetical protein